MLYIKLNRVGRPEQRKFAVSANLGFMLSIKPRVRDRSGSQKIAIYLRGYDVSFSKKTFLCFIQSIKPKPVYHLRRSKANLSCMQGIKPK